MKFNRSVAQSEILKQIYNFDKKNFDRLFKAITLLQQTSSSSVDVQYRIKLFKEIRDGYYTFRQNAKGKKFGFIKSPVYAQLFKYLHRQIHYNEHLKNALELHEKDLANHITQIKKLEERFQYLQEELMRVNDQMQAMQTLIDKHTARLNAVNDRVIEAQTLINEHNARLNAVSEFQKHQFLGKSFNYSSANKLFYSQFGEDGWVASHLAIPKAGYFIDVGAADGITFSNTYYFEKQGWKGICLEPNPENYQLASQVRRDVRQLAVSGKNGTQKFLVSAESADWSRLLSKNDEVKDEDIIEVKTITLDELVRNEKIQQIDLLSIDTEGTEIEVLHSLDFTKYHPQIIIVEHLNRGALNSKKDIQDFFKPLPYKLAHATKSNFILVYEK